MSDVRLKVLKVEQPIGEFYVGAIEARALNAIATVDVREFLDRKAKDLAGIQRVLSTTRVKEIAQYVNFSYATFPTSVVIAVDERCVALKEAKECDGIFDLTISGYDGGPDDDSIPLEEAAFIIDGQHRLAGLESLDADRKFEVNISIFIGADLADKAEIFSTVNLAQTKVNRSLVYDLFAYAEKPSPFKMAHEVTIALDRDPSGPFYEKIKRLGVTSPSRTEETLSQATVVNGILRHMPTNPDLEKNKGFLGLSNRAEEGENWRRRIFLPFYRADDDVSIFKIMKNYFGAVQERWQTAWDDNEKGFILNRTNGYNALIRFLQDAYLALVQEPRVVSVDEFRSIFQPMKVEAGQFTADRFKPGSSGASELYHLLVQHAPTTALS